jgi:zinc protease
MNRRNFVKIALAAFFFVAYSLSVALYALEPSQSLRNDPALVSGLLSNGMAYYALRNTEPANRIFLRLAIKAGSILEDDDQKGIAHLVEHMAFNGTAQFAKNDLIDYFESIGMKFGPEINAYTSFDETVYMLEIPADKRDVLLTSLNVLKDWASGITFDQAELDKERGVVVEEWRLGRGVNGRVNDKQIPFLLGGSRYADRLTIGDPEIIKTVSKKRVVDFYQKWYRSDLMSIVVVGDIDTGSIVNDLVSSVATVPAPATPTVRPTWDIPINAKADQLVIRDPEYPYVVIQMMGQYPALQISTKDKLRENLVISMAFAAFNQRLKEKVTAADPVMLNAQSGFTQLAKPTVFSYVALVPSTGKFIPAMQQAITELERFERFGMTDAELARQKESTLNAMEQAWLNRNKVNSANKASSIVQYVLYGNMALSSDDQRDLYKEIVPTITKEEVSAVVDKYWKKGRGDLFMVIAPESTKDVPPDAELTAAWRDWKPDASLAAYSESGLDRPLAVPGATPVGKIVSEKILLELPGGDASPSSIKEWKLSNGVRVILCPTKFKDNEIVVSAWSKGGYLMASDAEFPSLAIAQSLRDLSGLNGFNPTELGKKLAGKTVRAGIWIDEAQEGLWGSSSVADLETLFQLLNLQMTAPSYTDEGWGSLKAQMDKIAESRKTDPASMFEDLKTRLLYGNDIRHSTLTPEFVAKIDKTVAETASRARFANAKDFTFIFAGSFNETLMRKYAETWLAGLPSAGKADKPKSSGLHFPKGIVSENLSMGIDPKSQVYMAFGGNTKLGAYDPELFSMLTRLLDIRLREVVREDMSGSYGVSVNGNFSVAPSPYYELSISFGCEPGREDSLSQAVIATIKELQAAPVAASYITKLQENFRRSREESLRTNGYWIDRIGNMEWRNLPLSRLNDTDAIAAIITGEKLQELAKRYLNTKNYLRSYLEPAKK